jgi:hypothetical protein
MKRIGIGMLTCSSLPAKRRSLTFLLESVVIIGAVAASTGALATDYTSCTLPRPTCTKYSGRPSVVYLKDFNCNADPTGPNPISDRQCWQDALDCAYDAVTSSFGTVVGTQGVQYEIDGTLCVNTTYHGVINGNGARLAWTGPTSEDAPMWFLVDTQELKIENLQVISGPGPDRHPLDTAFEFTNSASTDGVAPNQNSLDHVRIEGNSVNWLNYGVRFSFRLGYSVDANNDLSIIKDSMILNPTVSAISIEHGNSMYHRFINVASSGAINAPCSSFVSLHRRRTVADACNAVISEVCGPPPQTPCPPLPFGGQGGSGSFSVYDFSGGGFTNADYEMSSAVSNNILIVHHNSESSKRLLEAVGVSSGAWPVHFIGGRFAVDKLNTVDHQWIKFDRNGPLRIDDMVLDHINDNPFTPVLLFDPPDIGGANSPVLELNGLQIQGTDTATMSGLVSLGSNPNPKIRVHSEGNMCFSDGANFVASGCPEILGGATTFSALGTQPNGVSIYCSNCGADPSTGGCASGGSGATARRVNGAWRCDGAELTLSGSQTISNKTLDGSNSFPSTLTSDTEWDTVAEINAHLTDGKTLATTSGTERILGFNVLNPGSTQKYGGPNVGSGAPNDTSDGSVALPVPAIVLANLNCKASPGPGGGKTWRATIFKNGIATAMLCDLTGTSNPTCSFAASTISATAGQTLSLEVRKTVGNNPQNSTVVCTVEGRSP